jgi:hypothetical protein
MLTYSISLIGLAHYATLSPDGLFFGRISESSPNEFSGLVKLAALIIGQTAENGLIFYKTVAYLVLSRPS